MAEKIKTAERAAKESSATRLKPFASQSRSAERGFDLNAGNIHANAGNLAMQRLFHAGVIQAKLEISQPGDIHEQEADQVADRVMRMPEAANSLSQTIHPSPLDISRKVCPSCQQELNRQAETCQPLRSEALCPECRQKLMVDENLSIQRQATAGGTLKVSSRVNNYVHRGGADGQPLAPSVRRFMEPKLGRDFSHVRVYTDAQASQAARAINATAFTHGQDIYFGQDKFQPGTNEGNRLLAHELTHVVQQGQSGQQMVHRYVGGDITRMNITPGFASALTDDELIQQIGILRRLVIKSHQAGPETESSLETESARENLDILQAEQTRRVAVREGINAPLQSKGGTLEGRVQAFKQLVLAEARVRLTVNQLNLGQWRELVKDAFSGPELMRQTYAQLSQDLYRRAIETGGEPAFQQWAGESNPYMREIRRAQVEGSLRACAGCHYVLQAEAKTRSEPSWTHVGPAWQAPMDRIQELASPQYGMGSQSGNFGFPSPSASAPSHGADIASGRSTQVVLDAVRRIRPQLEPLGPYGYKVLPQELLDLFGNATPEQLRAAILEKIDSRISDYETLKQRIADGDVEYLELTPILNELLPAADADVRSEIEDEIWWKKFWGWVWAGIEFILLLLSFIFPPAMFALGAIQMHSGYQAIQQGYTYKLSTGAYDVSTRHQQESADELMAMGTFNIMMGSTMVVASAPGTFRWASGPFRGTPSAEAPTAPKPTEPAAAPTETPAPPKPAETVAAPAEVPAAAPEPVRVASYGELTGELKGTGGQANHLNQNAAFRDVIPQNEGAAVAMRGNAFTEPGTPHFEFHKSLENFWDQFRPGGARFGERPTCGEYGQGLNDALQAGGFSAQEAGAIGEAASVNRTTHGLTDGDFVPRIPGRLGQRKPP